VKKAESTSAEAAELRRRAEARLESETAGENPPRTEADTRRLLHELQVHQIELEMQNTELRQARDELEAALEKYTSLYEFAPVGYFTLDREGAVRAVNLSGSSLLGVERALLIGRRFGQFVGADDRSAFSTFFNKVFAGRDKDSCEVTLTTAGNFRLFAHIEAVAFETAQECRVTVIDITTRKEAEEKIQVQLEKLRVLNEELTRFDYVSVGRELRMIELKKEINELCALTGRPARYALDFEKE
jgi:PAS domain S-box-containing protein